MIGEIPTAAILGAIPTGQRIIASSRRVARLSIPMQSNAAGVFKAVLPRVRGKILYFHARYGNPTPDAFTLAIADMASGETDTTAAIADGVRYTSGDESAPFLLIVDGPLNILATGMGDSKQATITLWIEDPDM